VAHEGFLQDKCGPRAKKFEHHCTKECVQCTFPMRNNITPTTMFYKNGSALLHCISIVNYAVQ